MSQLEIKDLNSNELRKFGFMMALMIILMFGLLIPWIFNKQFLNIWILAIASGFVATSLLCPGLLRPVYYNWMKFALIIGKFNTIIILGLVFYVLFTPIALAMKLFKRDILERSFNKKINTYQLKITNRKSEHMEKPF